MEEGAKKKIKLNAPACPSCGEDLSRIPKNGIDKLLSHILEVRRYKCHRCFWTGRNFSWKQSHADSNSSKDNNSTQNS